jgi:ATP-dependent HslUV protease subunit HslV
MTIIAYRDGVMAADSMATKAAYRYGTIQKIKHLYDGALFAAAGAAADCDSVFHWLFHSGAKPKISEEDGFRAMLVRPGCPYPFEIDGNLIEHEIHMPFLVVGESTAEHVCLGAMEAGATAEEAVNIAIKLCVWIGGPVQVERVLAFDE